MWKVTGREGRAHPSWGLIFGGNAQSTSSDLPVQFRLSVEWRTNTSRVFMNVEPCWPRQPIVWRQMTGEWNTLGEGQSSNNSFTKQKEPNHTPFIDYTAGVCNFWQLKKYLYYKNFQNIFKSRHNSITNLQVLIPKIQQLQWSVGYLPHPSSLPIFLNYLEANPKYQRILFVNRSVMHL